jgi:hypothetical protein
MLPESSAIIMHWKEKRSVQFRSKVSLQRNALERIATIAVAVAVAAEAAVDSNSDNRATSPTMQ